MNEITHSRHKQIDKQITLFTTSRQTDKTTWWRVKHM